MRTNLATSRAARGLIIIALVAGSLTATTAPASADEFSPILTSFERVSPGLLGPAGFVSITFDAVDEGPAGLSYAMFTYRTPMGAEFRVDSPWMNRAPSGSFTATKSIGLWGASGDYVLEKVEVLDREWNSTVYERGVATQFDWAAADFSVDNPTQDVTVPTLTSATLFQKAVLQGTPVVVLYTAQDDLSGVEKVVFTGWSPTRGQFWIESLPQLGMVGPAAWVIPLESASGLYEMSGVQVIDRAGNYIFYELDRTGAYPPKASVPEHTSPNIADLSFSVEGVVGDRISPVMSQLSMLTPKDRRLGETVALGFSASDSGTGIEQIAAQWVDELGHAIDASKYCADRTDSHLSTVIDDYRTIGSNWELRSVAFADYLGNQTSYMRDGRILYNNADPGPATHSFDLSLGDFHIEDGSARPAEYSNTTPLWCPKVADVLFAVDDSTISLGETVNSFGEVTLDDDPIDEPIVAIHEYTDGVPGLIAVVQGDDNGEFVDSFVAEAKGRLQATFLGTDGPLGSDRSTSAFIDLVVGVRVDATLSDATIPLGASSQITGAVDPVGPGGSVWLQRKYPWGWKDLRSTTMTEGGFFRFSIKPLRARVYRYRILRPGTDTLAASKSRVLTLTVR